MSPHSRIVALVVLGLLIVAGCTFNKSELRRDADNVLARVGGNGQIIAPKWCALQVAFLTRPVHDEAIGATLWNVADEQVLAPEVRHALERNGLRVGMISGSLPAEVESLLNAPAPEKVDRMQFMLPDGGDTRLSLSEMTPTASLLLCDDDRAYGKDYKDASGWYSVTAKQEGPSGISLRFVPEIHHGPIQHSFGAIPTGGVLAPQQFRLKDGQAEDVLRELAATLTLQPGQVAVLGCRVEKERSLGTFLFTQPEANSDRLLQKVVLIWASRSSQGLPSLEPADPPDSDMPHPLATRQKADRPRPDPGASPKGGKPVKN